MTQASEILKQFNHALNHSDYETLARLLKSNLKSFLLNWQNKKVIRITYEHAQMEITPQTPECLAQPFQWLDYLTQNNCIALKELYAQAFNYHFEKTNKAYLAQLIQYAKTHGMCQSWINEVFTHNLQRCAEHYTKKHENFLMLIHLGEEHHIELNQTKEFLKTHILKHKAIIEILTHLLHSRYEHQLMEYGDLIASHLLTEIESTQIHAKILTIGRYRTIPTNVKEKIDETNKLLASIILNMNYKPCEEIKKRLSFHPELLSLLHVRNAKKDLDEKLKLKPVSVIKIKI